MNTLTSRLLILIGVLSGLLFFSGCGGGGSSSTAIPDPLTPLRTIPHALLFASGSGANGVVSFYDPTPPLGSPTTTLEWSEYTSAVKDGSNTVAIGLPNLNEQGAPQFYLIIKENKESPANVRQLDCQVITGLGYSDVTFSLVVSAGLNPTTSVVFPAGSSLQASDLVPTPGNDIATFGALVNLRLFDFLGKNNSALRDSFTPAIGSAVAQTYAKVYAGS